MKVAFVLCISAALLSVAEMKFRHHVVDGVIEGKNWGILELADIDGDGRLDIVIGQSHWGNKEPGLYWYRNTGRVDEWGERTLFAKDNISDCGAAAVDVDGDGRTDIISSSIWYRNPGNGGFFERYVYDKQVAETPRSGAHDVMAIRFGGGLSVIVQHGSLKAYKALHVYQVPAGGKGEWPRTDLMSVVNQHGAIAPKGIGDLNGDGRPDFVYIDRWFENFRSVDWKPHENLVFGRQSEFGVCARSWVADMDRDGRMDVIQAECDIAESKVAWFRNVRGDGSEWEKRVLPDEAASGDYHSLGVADFDGDGDLDVYVDEMEHLHLPESRSGKPAMYVWENMDGGGKNWKKHCIVEGFGGHQAQVADLDGDGDPDVVTKTYSKGPGASAVKVSVLENVSKRQ